MNVDMMHNTILKNLLFISINQYLYLSLCEPSMT